MFNFQGIKDLGCSWALNKTKLLLKLHFKPRRLAHYSLFSRKTIITILI